MVNFTNDTIQANAISCKVCACLATREAMAPATLAAISGLAWSVLSEVLDALEREGKVEVLRPMFSETSRSRKTPKAHNGVHYRLVRPTDSDCVWQQAVNAVPASDRRVRETMRLERARSHAATHRWAPGRH